MIFYFKSRNRKIVQLEDPNHAQNCHHNMKGQRSALASTLCPGRCSLQQRMLSFVYRTVQFVCYWTEQNNSSESFSPSIRCLCTELSRFLTALSVNSETNGLYFLIQQRQVLKNLCKCNCKECNYKEKKYAFLLWREAYFSFLPATVYIVNKVAVKHLVYTCTYNIITAALKTNLIEKKSIFFKYL